jgi:hypothetical protein
MIVDASFLCVSEHITHGLVYIHVCLISAFFVFIMLCLLIKATLVESVKVVSKNKMN